jgi:hypothetical protein
VDALPEGCCKRTGVVEMLDPIRVNEEMWYVSTCVLPSATERQHSLLLEYECVSSGRLVSTLVLGLDHRGSRSKLRFVFNTEHLQGSYM